MEGIPAPPGSNSSGAPASSKEKSRIKKIKISNVLTGFFLFLICFINTYNRLFLKSIKHEKLRLDLFSFPFCPAATPKLQRYSIYNYVRKLDS